MIDSLSPDSGPFPALLHSLTEERVAKVLDSLIVAHRNGTLTPQEALSGVASMSALRLLPADLARRIRQAQ